MAYEPLHHKYRPQTFAELTGQEAIAQTLTNALNSDKIAPAYLFSGPRGTGKTSSARILAKSLNCINYDHPTPTPCGKCEVCVSITNGSALDVIEIDAASNTGVDNIREIIERSQFAPVKCRYKVYVIDECHMLSTAAFNALLKTLEEPPPRVIFVLATTDPQRVLPTIISRCQRFDYRRIPLDAMVKHLREIANKENIEIDDEALSLVAQLSNGGMRDAQSLLDQLSLLSGTITSERVWDLVGAVSEQDLLALLEAIASDKTEIVISQCRKLLDRGREPLIVLQNLANFYLNLLIAKTSPQSKELIAVTEDTWQKLCQVATNWQLNVILQGQKKLKESEFQIKNTTQPRLWLEITLLGLLPSANQIGVINQAITSVNSPITTTVATKPPVKETESRINSPLSSPVESKPSESTQFAENQTKSVEISANQLNQPKNQQELKELVIQHCQQNTTKAFFRQYCRIVSFDGNLARITVKNNTLLNMANAAKKDIELSFKRIVNHPVTVVIEIDSEMKSESLPSSSSLPPTIEETPSNDYGNKITEKSNSPNNSISTKSKKNLNNKSSIKDQTSVKQKKQDNQVDTETKIVNSPSNSESKITKNAADNLAKNLDGEIVLIECKTPFFTNNSNPTIPKVINRTEITQFENEDDIPF